MARSLSVGDTVYIIGRYGFTQDHHVFMVKAMIYTIKNNRYHAYELPEYRPFEWSFNEKDIGITVFTDRENAWKACEKIKKEWGKAHLARN